jgi:hypothetical protein
MQEKKKNIIYQMDNLFMDIVFARPDQGSFWNGTIQPNNFRRLFAWLQYSRAKLGFRN